MKVIIIAEAGVNHNGSLEIAKEMIDLADEAGADYVKFQTFKAESLVTKIAKKADYQIRLTDKDESQYKMIKKLELDEKKHKELISYCNRKKIRFLSAPFDIKSIDLLRKFKLPLYKIPSGEITNLPFLRKIGQLGKPVILSTGMSTLKEIDMAVGILVDSGLKKHQIKILHCNTEYPTPIEDVNLNAMIAIKKKFGVKVGYSDHTLGIETPIAAVALGATIIEKHFTLDRNMPGPDHFASLNPNELKEMVVAIRNIEKAMGSGIKKPNKSEIKNIPIVRKSIVAKKDIKRGEKFTIDNLSVKRPGTGVSPMEWDNYIGKYSDTNYIADDLIK